MQQAIEGTKYTDEELLELWEEQEDLSNPNIYDSKKEQEIYERYFKERAEDFKTIPPEYQNAMKVFYKELDQITLGTRKDLFKKRLIDKLEPKIAILEWLISCPPDLQEYAYKNIKNCPNPDTAPLQLNALKTRKRALKASTFKEFKEAMNQTE